MWWCVCFNATLSIRPTLFFPHCVHKSVLYICISITVLQIGSSLPFFLIPHVCVNIQYLSFSFWLTLLCIIGSRFIHLIRTESNVFLFKAEQYSIVYMYHNFFIHSSIDEHLRLLPCFSYCKYCCSEHWGTCDFFNYTFFFMYFLNGRIIAL